MNRSGIMVRLCVLLAVSNASSGAAPVFLFPGPQFEAGNWAQPLAAGDLDGDGDGDLAVANHYDANVSIL